MRLRFGDGTSARVYRETVAGTGPVERPCILVVGFRLRAVRGRGHALFRWESLLNTPLFAGFPGLVSKLWFAHDEHGVHRGLYEWDGPDRAEYYARCLWRVLERAWPAGVGVVLALGVGVGLAVGVGLLLGAGLPVGVGLPVGGGWPPGWDWPLWWREAPDLPWCPGEVGVPGPADPGASVPVWTTVLSRGTRPAGLTDSTRPGGIRLLGCQRTWTFRPRWRNCRRAAGTGLPSSVLLSTLTVAPRDGPAAATCWGLWPIMPISSTAVSAATIAAADCCAPDQYTKLLRQECAAKSRRLGTTLMGSRRRCRTLTSATPAGPASAPEARDARPRSSRIQAVMDLACTRDGPRMYLAKIQAHQPPRAKTMASAGHPAAAAGRVSGEPSTCAFGQMSRCV
jgi:hypothetical protein